VGISDVLAFAEKTGLIENEQGWKEPCDVRDAINHEHQEYAKVLSVLVAEMLNLVEPLMAIHLRAEQYCRTKLGVKTIAVDDGEG